MTNHVEELAARLYCTGGRSNVDRIWALETNEAFKDMFRDMARLAIKYCQRHVVEARP